jgi:cytochrome P450
VSDQLLDDIVEPLRDGAVVDLRARLAKPLMIRLFSELFGVPESDGEHLSVGVSDVMAATVGMTEALLTVADERTAWIEEYFGSLIERRRKNLGDDLLSTLIRAHGEGSDTLSDEELIATVWGMWFAGYESTSGGIDIAVMYMLAHPEERGWLDSEDGALRFVDEVMRHEAFVLLSPLPRLAMRDVRFEGGTVPEGAPVQVVLAAANRDPEAFPDPDRFLPSRDTSASLTFGQGIHHCLGAGLARTEMAIVLRRLNSRFPGLVAAGEAPRSPLFLQRALVELPVRLGR